MSTQDCSAYYTIAGFLIEAAALENTNYSFEPQTLETENKQIELRVQPHPQPNIHSRRMLLIQGRRQPSIYLYNILIKRCPPGPDTQTVVCEQNTSKTQA